MIRGIAVAAGSIGMLAAAGTTSAALASTVPPWKIAVTPVAAVTSRTSFDHLTVVNEGSHAQQVTVSMQAIAREGDKCVIGHSELDNWAHVTPNYVRLQPNQARTVDVQLNVPRGASQSGETELVAQFVGSTGAGFGGHGNRVIVKGEVGSLLLVKRGGSTARPCIALSTPGAPSEIPWLWIGIGAGTLAGASTAGAYAIRRRKRRASSSA
jgi:hypothetical protein